MECTVREVLALNAELKNLVNKFKKSGHFTGNNANLQELINRVNKTNKNVTLNAFNTALKSWIKGHQTNIHTKTKNVTNPFTAWNLGAQALGKKGRPMYGRSSNPLYNVQNNLINKEHTIYKLYKGGELKNNVGLTAYKAYLRSLAAYKNAKAANNAAKAAAPARPRPAPVPSASQIISKLKLGTKSGFRWKSQNSLIQGKNGKYYVSPATGYVYVKHNGEYIWKEANELTYDDEILMCIQGTEDKKCEKENNWSLEFGNFSFNQLNIPCLVSVTIPIIDFILDICSCRFILINQ